MKVLFVCESVKVDYNADTEAVVSRRTYTFPFLENERVLPNIDDIISIDKLCYRIRTRKVNYITEDTVLHIDTIVFRATREV